MHKAVTVNTVQGIGDIFWVYQKLAPHFDVINLNVLCVDSGVVQTRAKAFCAMLPKVARVEYRVVPGGEYHRVAGTTFALADVIRRALRGSVDYAVNAPLEAGTSLRDMDGEAPIEEFVDLGLPVVVERGDYLCVFVAGAKNSTLWTPAQWVPAIDRLARRLDTRHIVLVGASWDVPAQAPIQIALRAAGFDVESHVAVLGLSDTMNVIRRSRYFLGYQSGLNVLADNYDVRQCMIYFTKLRPMLYTWCKPENVRTRFHAATFDEDVNVIIDRLPV